MFDLKKYAQNSKTVKNEFFKGSFLGGVPFAIGMGSFAFIHNPIALYSSGLLALIAKKLFYKEFAKSEQYFGQLENGRNSYDLPFKKSLKNQRSQLMMTCFGYGLLAAAVGRTFQGNLPLIIAGGIAASRSFQEILLLTIVGIKLKTIKLLQKERRKKEIISRGIQQSISQKITDNKRSR